MVGKTISHYRILDKIGEGGMGVVYKAEDTKLERSVAVKFLRPEATDSEETTKRFLQEAKAAARLDHPHICTVHEIDQVEGQMLMAMAYVDGPSLKVRIEERPLKLDEALEIALQIGDEVARGDITHGLNISDVWKNSYSENTSRKVWAAKYIARHLNLIALKLSSFKCGHDAPIYTVVEQVIERIGTPYFCFKDIDENKPSGSIKIRVETIGYFLTRYREDIVKNKGKERDIDDRLREYELQLRAEMLREPLGSTDQERLIRESFQAGSMLTIHVGVEQLAASNPAHREEETSAVAGD